MQTTDLEELESLSIPIPQRKSHNNILVLTTIHDNENWLPNVDNHLQRYCIDEAELHREVGKPVTEIRQFDQCIILYGGSDIGNRGIEWFLGVILTRLEFLFPSVILLAENDEMSSVIPVFDMIKSNISPDSATRFIFLTNSKDSKLHALAELLRLNKYHITETMMSKSEQEPGACDCNTQKQSHAISTMLHRAYHDKGIPYDRDFARTVDESVDYWWHIKTYCSGWKAILYVSLLIVEMLVMWSLASYKIIPDLVAFVLFCVMIGIALVPMALNMSRLLFLWYMY